LALPAEAARRTVNVAKAHPGRLRPPTMSGLHWPGRRVGAAAVIVDASGRVLLVRHTYGRLNWELPGGASEPGESVIETALRELREEAGVEALADQLTGVYWDSEYDAHHLVFRCRLVDEGRPLASSAEISACDFWPPDRLPRPISDFTIRRVHDALADAPQLLPVTIPPRAWLD
jgi:8-oxo-dGTP diphosphatase